jgi:STE24 endopeptidase
VRSVNQDKSARYHSLRRRAAVASAAWSLLYLLAFTLTPASRWLADALQARVASAGVPASFAPTLLVLAYVAAFGIGHETMGFLAAFYRGYLLEHRYGLSNERLASWLADQAKAAALGAGLALAGFGLLYAAIRQWPQGWWAAAGLGFTLFVVVMTRLAPVLLLPLFFTFRPLGRDELRRRLLRLAERAGVPAVDACEWQLSDRTKKANAALTGLGRTRRVIVSDTLLANHSDDEIEAVLAHELGHHAHHDIWKGIGLEAVVALAGFYLASRVLVVAAPRLGWSGPADVAGLPVLLLTAGLLSFALVPGVNACSRRMERAADRFAFELTGTAAPFASAMQRLGAQNLAEQRPSLLARWFFYTHPPFEERILAARQWEAARGGTRD